MISYPFRHVIADSTCLILLSKIGALELLHELFGEISITSAVRDEFGEMLPTWIHVRDSIRATTFVLPRNLGRGESSSIQLTSELGGDALLILDDLNARRAARRLELRIIGTLGVLLEAKAGGVIESVHPFIAKIRQTNFFITEDLLSRTLELAGEDAE